MKKYLLIILLITGLIPSSIWCINLSDENKDLLRKLDEIILQKESFHQEREQQIQRYRNQLTTARTDLEKYNLYNHLFQEYLHYQADSALNYINLKQELKDLPNKPMVEQETHINRAEIFGVMSMYNEALNELEKVDTKQLNEQLLSYYYHTYRAFNGWAADYSTDPQSRNRYLTATDLYRDSILLHSNSEIDSEIVLSEKMILKNEVNEAIDNLLKLNDKTQDNKFKAYINFTLSEAYELKHDTANQIKYLAKTAMVDIERAVREYASLQKLAILIYLQGDLERAYQYLNCSMEDAVACNARLRFIEFAEFYPIVENTYKEKVKQRHDLVRILLISVSTLALLLSVALGYLYYWNKKLSIIKKELHSANYQLINVNKDLEQTGKIKDTYITRYLDRCVSYLNKLEQYRRSLEKLAMASKVEELFKMIRSEEFLRNERKLFYDEFDKSFLELFPNFINDFNELLVEDGKIFPKSNEKLNTELRIFALIRLGVTEAAHIAQFLGYSLTTVYNYRSKIRNKAKGDKDKFEQEVMNL